MSEGHDRVMGSTSDVVPPTFNRSRDRRPGRQRDRTCTQHPRHRYWCRGLAQQMRNPSPSGKRAAGLTSCWTPLTHPAGKGDSSLKEGPERRNPRARAAAGNPSSAAPRRWRRAINMMTSGTQGGGLVECSTSLPPPSTTTNITSRTRTQSLPNPNSPEQAQLL